MSRDLVDEIVRRYGIEMMTSRMVGKHEVRKFAATDVFILASLLTVTRFIAVF